MFLRGTEQKAREFNLKHYKYKPIISTLVSELFTCQNCKKDFSEIKANGFKHSHSGG